MGEGKQALWYIHNWRSVTWYNFCEPQYGHSKWHYLQDWLSTTTLLVTTKDWKQPKYSSIKKWLNKLRYVRYNKLLSIHDKEWESSIHIYRDHSPKPQNLTLWTLVTPKYYNLMPPRLGKKQVTFILLIIGQANSWQKM